MIDFRKFYHMSLSDVGKTVSYEEGWALLTGLLEDPASHYFAKVNFWKYPESRLERYILDLIDLTIQANWDSKNGKAPQTPRPYQRNGDTITAKPMTLERAKQLYKVKRTTKTDEEIRELNRKFLEQTRKENPQ